MTQSGSCIDPCFENLSNNYLLGSRCRLAMFEILLRLFLLLLNIVISRRAHLWSHGFRICLQSSTIEWILEELATPVLRELTLGFSTSKLHNHKHHLSQHRLPLRITLHTVLLHNNHYSNNGARTEPSIFHPSGNHTSASIKYAQQLEPSSSQSSTTTTSTPPPSASVYKPRTLFCVVCASNQASN
ncbi:hypothetical protein BDZ97DRAFT_3405 [Flammula alnicola]|nr:hypothetical protein BDZ97DRAFT_3405 [Flammula alnicola]